MALWSALVEPVANVFCKGLDIIDDMVEDKDLAAKLRAGIESKIRQIASTEFLALLQAQSSIIIAEAKGDSWLQRNWRPLIMATFGAIIANNYLLAPYLGLLLGKKYKVMLAIPPDMWALLKLGLSGYVVGRSAEKIAGGAGIKGVVGKLVNGGATQ